MLLAVAARGDDGRDDDDMTERQKSEESSRAAQWRLARVLCIKHFSHSAVFLSLSLCRRCMYSRWTQTPRRCMSPSVPLFPLLNGFTTPST